MNKATSPTGKYGVLDTKDNCWMGDEVGPLRYDEHELACAAATIINEQFGFTSRFRAREIDAGKFREKDTVVAPITAGEAMKRIEAKSN